MRPEEAIRDVEFIKMLVAGTRRTGDAGAPFLLLWGVIWVVGYLLPVLGVRGDAQGAAWWALDLAGFAGSLLLLRRMRRPLTYLWRGILWSWGILLAVAGALTAAVLPRLGDGRIDGAFWMAVVGVAYLQAGYFAGPWMALLGGWLVLVAAVGLALPLPWYSLLYAVAGGGGLLLAAALLWRGARHGG